MKLFNKKQKYYILIGRNKIRVAEEQYIMTKNLSNANSNSDGSWANGNIGGIIKY
jgi:hypothetical protein